MSLFYFDCFLYIVIILCVSFTEPGVVLKRFMLWGSIVIHHKVMALICFIYY